MLRPEDPEDDVCRNHVRKVAASLGSPAVGSSKVAELARFEPIEHQFEGARVDAGAP
jgi:hypothetical protein